MISFPGLLSRHCTNDWLNPPVDLKGLAQETSMDLYYQGVDAHSGEISVPPALTPDEPLKLRQVDSALFNKDPFDAGHEYQLARRDTEATLTMARESRLGSSIGSAAHRRLSSLPAIQPLYREEQGTVLPSLMDRIKEGGHKIFHPHHTAKSPGDTDWPTASSFVVEDNQHTNTPQSGDEAWRQHAPGPDGASIYKALTSNQLVVNHKRRHTCSEDHKPHRCEADLMTPNTGQVSPT